MQMPQMDGFSLVEDIRKNRAMDVATIMMVASGARRGDLARCRELGLSAFLVKPVVRTNYGIPCSVVERLRKARRLENRPTRRWSAGYSVVRRLARVLAEDNAVNQRLATRLLEKRGHHSTVAGTGREALEMLEHIFFDLILMDVQMPLVDGLEATKIIRERERETGTHVPIVALTAHAVKGDLERCTEAGMDGYLTKPIRPEELDVVLQKYMTWIAKGRA